MIAYIIHFTEVFGAALRVSAALQYRKTPAAEDLKTLNVSASAFTR